MILRQKIKQFSVLLIQKRLQADPAYLDSFLTSREIRYCVAKRHPAEPAAARLAAKQACLALLKIPAAQKKWLLHIEICKKNNGQPFFKFSPQLKAKIKLSDAVPLLSLAHERKMAIAWVAQVKARK